MPRQALRKMITKFEDSVELEVLQGRGRKGISNEIVEEVSLAMVKRASGFQYSPASAPAVSCYLYPPLFTVRKILLFIVKWYLYRICVSQELQTADLDKRTDFANHLLTRRAVDNIWTWSIWTKCILF